MARQGEMVGDGEVCAKLSEFIIIELPSVVRDNNLENPESIDDVFLYEIFSVFFVILARGSISIHLVK